MSLLPFITDSHFQGEGSKLLADLTEARYQTALTSTCADSILKPCRSRDRANVTLLTGHKWRALIQESVTSYLRPQQDVVQERRKPLFLVALAALHAFLQANVTGPPLNWSARAVFFGEINDAEYVEIRKHLAKDLSSDGIAAYHLVRHVELFSLASVIVNHSLMYSGETSYLWSRLRVNFLQQQLLSELSSSLQSMVYQDISLLDYQVLSSSSTHDSDVKVQYLLERAAINTFHGFDKKAREDLRQATERRHFQYILTGRPGRRTKFQQHDISQLVVLAKSATAEEKTASEGDEDLQNKESSHTARPKKLDLNDDTLLEAISFSKNSQALDSNNAEDIPPALAALDPSNQPPLHALDSIILLSTASSITNTSPQHGLTREETLPYATRVIESGSTNWQIFTQALLVRSRIEGYRSRTVERGVLQLQALVDQIIAETTGTTPGGSASVDSTTTFLPRPKESESASASERLRYIHQLASPLTWALESELASRWVALGGLRTALEIFERLELWAEAALCWAATDREDKARQIVRLQLYRRIGSELTDGQDEAAEEHKDNEASPLPADAPRLFCILGDLDKEPKHYERAWDVSNKRYARAQRSLGKHYLASKDLEKADEAYAQSLAINPQNAATWFSLGCVRLETMKWEGAVSAFTRCVQIEEDDAEAWSNLAAALLRLPHDETAQPQIPWGGGEEASRKSDPQKHTKEAFVAFKRATAIKRDSYRIWQNLLNVAATLSPPPYTDIIIAQQRLIELRSKAEGESCVDVEVLEGILSHIVAMGSSAKVTNGDADTEQPRKRYGLENMFSDLIQKQVVPLITQSRRLWQLVARLAIYQKKPATALDAYEKAWRTTLNTPGWDEDSGATGASTIATGSSTSNDPWKEVVDSTIELVDAYESLGEKEITEGLGAGSGELVCKNWKYKARMAIRSVVGRRQKAGFEDVESLQERTNELKQ